MNNVMTFKPKRTDSYLVTIQNTPEGRGKYKSIHKLFRELGCRVMRYGRGPRKKIYHKLAKNPKNWESKYPWTPWRNNHYRPKLAVCTHFDVYIYT